MEEALGRKVGTEEALGRKVGTEEGEATEMAAIPVVEVSKSNRISPFGREREMRDER